MTDIPTCERCGSHNMKVVTDGSDLFCGWWKCYDCGYIGDKDEDQGDTEPKKVEWPKEKKIGMWERIAGDDRINVSKDPEDGYWIEYMTDRGFGHHIRVWIPKKDWTKFVKTINAANLVHRGIVRTHAREKTREDREIERMIKDYKEE